ncbi:MAG: glycosyltransferase, partial [Candidatus Eremiobacterota bacterium]
MKNNKILIFIPTYNERDNVEKMCNELINLKLPADILFIDDNSPDGTGKVIDELCKKYKDINVIHRNGKAGIGSAHQCGIKWAYENHYNTLITMDCDFTHNPSYITAMIDKSKDYDVVVTSRYILKDSLEEWNLIRKILTLTGHFLTTLLLKMPYDASGAFRLYNLTKIPHNVFKLVSSLSYSFFFESLYILHINKFSIAEIPIKLPARTYGHSKMAFNDILNSLKLLTGIYLNTLFNKEKFEHSVPFTQEAKLSNDISSEWDNYWENQKNTSGLIYDAIAAFYRKYIIKRTLNHFVTKYFHNGSKVIHAGCGGGQVDTEIRHKLSIIALDISINALNFYKKVNKNYCNLLHGSIFSIPLPDE